MREVIVELLGEYTPNLLPDGSAIGGLYSIDFTWIVGAIAFLMLLMGFLWLLRILLKALAKIS